MHYINGKLVFLLHVANCKRTGLKEDLFLGNDNNLRKEKVSKYSLLSGAFSGYLEDQFLITNNFINLCSVKYSKPVQLNNVVKPAPNKPFIALPIVQNIYTGLAQSKGYDNTHLESSVRCFENSNTMFAFLLDKRIY